MKIQIKHKVTGAVLFEHEQENNSIRITLELAVSKRANLTNANLSDANLINANLSDANLSDASLWNANLTNANLWNANLSDASLRNANLSDANLWNADLTNANLTNANLTNANLSDANLSDANLSDANLWNAIGNGVNVISAQIAKYRIIFTSEFMWIGCRKHPIKTWWKDSEKDAHKFTDEEKEWRLKNKRWINAFVKANPAQPTKVK